MFKHILLAYDGSPQARKAAELAAQLAREQQPPASLRLVCAVDRVPASLGEPDFSRAASERTLQGQALIREARGLLGEGLDLHEELLFGPAADEILSVAEIRQCDLIVMGTGGHHALQELLFGSQTQKVISHAPCPVMVVR